MPRRVPSWSEDIDPEEIYLDEIDLYRDAVGDDAVGDDAFVPASYVSGLVLPSPAELGLSAEESLHHRVRPLEVPAWAGDAGPAPAPAQAPRWAAKHGVAHLLAQPASALTDWPAWSLSWQPLLGSLTIEQCLLGRLSSLPKSHQRAFSDMLARSARDYVYHSAQRARLAAAREVSWARSPEPALEALVLELRRVHAELGRHPESERPVFLGGAVIAVGEDPPRVLARLPEAGYASMQLLLPNAAQEQPLQLRCSCGTAHCAHRRVLLEALLDAIYGGTALATELAEVVAVPSWQRLLGVLERVQSPPAEERAERLVWRLGPASWGVTVHPAVQQLNARGQWSAGRKLSPDAAARRSRVAPEDRAALAVFAALEPLSHSCGRGAALARLLEALVGHPRLCGLEPPYESLRLDTAPATIVAALAGEQLELGLSVGSRRVALENLPGCRLDERWGLIIAGAHATLFELPPATGRVLAVLARYGARLPPEAHDRAAELLTSLSRQIPIELPAALRGQLVAVRTSFVLRLVPRGAVALDAELLVRFGVQAGEGIEDGTPLGAEQRPGEGPRELIGCAGGRRVCARRDLEQELACAGALLERLGLLGLAAPLEPWRWTLEGDAALELVFSSRRLTSAAERELIVEWPASEPWQTRSLSKGDLRVRLDRSGQWFSIGGGVAVDGVEAGLATLLSAVRSGRRFVELGPGRFARVEAELAAAAERIDDVAHAVGGELVVAPAAALGLEALELPQLDGADEWRALCQRVAAAAVLEPEPPSTLRATLRHYQVDGYRWLARLSAWDAGACLADDMGLGKTVQCLSVLLSRPGPHLVVAPTSVGPNWLREAQVFAPSLRARLYRGPDRAALLDELGPGDLLITSYDLLALDAEVLATRELDTLVLDEAQAVKNARTRRARAARALRARFKLALTGTPIENHLGELWSILSIVSPGLLGPWEHFRERFAAPIERDGDRARLESLAAVLKPFILRRTKAMVAPELPPRTTVVEPVELSARERALYEAARQSALAELGDAARDERGRIAVLAALTRLRRLACHPGLVVDGYVGASSKLETLLGLVERLREAGQRALVFSQFTSFLALVKQALDARNIDYLYLDGQTPLPEREALVGAWREQRADLFLLSLKAGGSGLNLIGADAVIHLDPWWNPAVEDQATDRTHRIGQQRPVTAIRLIAQGTIEEAVLGLHEGKRALADGLLAGTDAAAQLSSAQLIELIRFGDGAVGAGAEEAAAALAPDASPVERSSPSEAVPGQRAPESAALEPDEPPRRLSGHDLAALRDPLEQRLYSEGLLAATARAYLRSYERMLELAQRDSGRRTLVGWYALSVDAHRVGKLAGPRNFPALLSAAVRRAALLGVPAVASPPL